MTKSSNIGIGTDLGLALVIMLSFLVYRKERAGLS